MVLRRTKYLPDRTIWMLKKGDRFKAQGHDFVIDQFYFPEVFYAAGNLTDSISQRQRNKQCFATSDQQCFVSVQRSSAVEYYSGKILSVSELKKAFTKPQHK